MKLTRRGRLSLALSAGPLAAMLAVAPLAPASAVEASAQPTPTEIATEPEATPSETATPTTAPSESPTAQQAPSEAAPSAAPTEGLTFDLSMGGRATVTEQNERVLGPGVVLTEFERLEPLGWQRGAILDVDLSNEAVTLDYLYSGEITETATVTEMANNAENIAAAINGDFFDINDTGAPQGIGVDREEGILKTPQAGSSNALILNSDNIAQITNAWTEGTVWIQQGSSMSANDTALRIHAVNPTSIPTDEVGVYTSAWGSERRLAKNADRTEGIEVWVDEKSTVTNVQAPGEGEIPAGTRIVAARPGGAPFEQLSAVEVGDKVQMSYTLRSNASDASVGISGGANLVTNGEPVVSRDAAVHPRTAVGVNEPGDRLLLAVVDGRSSVSRGMTLTELGQLMHDLGAHNAINFDGGGSTTMIARDPGDEGTDVVNSPSDGSERSDANGLGVQVAPGSPDLHSFDVETADGRRDSTELFPGLSRQLIAQGMNENLVAVEGEAAWTSSDPNIATVDSEGTVTAVSSGEVTITAANGEATGSIDLVVRGDLTRVVPSRTQLSLDSPGSTQTLSLTGYDSSGFGAPLDTKDIAIEVDPTFTIAPRDASTLVASSTEESASAVAGLTVGGITTNIPMTVGTESVPVTDLSDASEWTYRQDRASGDIEVTTDDDGNNALRLTHDFTQQTGTRGSYAVAPNGGIEIDGQPMAITMRVKGDGTGAWPRLQMRDGNGVTLQVNATSPAYVNFEGWQDMTFQIPSGTSYPLTLNRVRFMETSPSNQYMGDITFSQIAATVAPDVEFPNVDVYEDPAVDAAGSADEAPLKIAVVSDAQFVGRAPDSAQVTAAREVLREAVAAEPDRIIILGDWVDEGAAEDIALAETIIDEELGETGIEWIYVPGNHEAMGAPGMEPWHEAFGPGYIVEVVNGTKIITLDSHPYNISHNPEQVQFLRTELDEAIESDEITGVVLALHHPTQDNVTGASALNNAQDAKLIESWMAEVYDAGKSGGVLNAGVGAFDVYQVDGTTHVTNGNAGKSPNSTPDRGGFSGWTLIGIDPEAGNWRESNGEWLSVDIRPFVNSVTITGPDSVDAGNSILLSGTVDENGREVPLDWPVSYRWGSETETLYAGDPSTAPESAIATIDPREGTVTALDRVYVDGELAVMDSGITLTDEVEEVSVTANVLVNNETATHAVTVRVPVGEIAAEDESRDTVRVSGRNRVATSVAAVDAIARERGGIDSLVLVGHDGMPDALTGTPLAHALETGVAYTNKQNLSDEVVDLIERQSITSVTVLGGKNVVSDSVLAQLTSLGVEAERISGKNRWDTSVAIATELEEISDVQRVVYASGVHPADALVAGPLATKADAAILLTRENGIPANAQDFADEHASDGFYAVGGSSERATAGMDGLVASYAGKDRYATAAEIVEAEFTESDTVALANGEAEVDAATAGAWAATAETGVLLTHRDDIPAATVRLLPNFSRVVAFGGTQVISDLLLDSLVIE